MKDIDIRRELHKNHLSHVAYDPATIIRDEVGLCQGAVKIDIAVFNGNLIGYEIKSEQDTLYRLATQMEIYNKVFDFMNIVINEKHVESVKKIIPQHWGIMQVIKWGKDSFKIDVLRPAEKNPDCDSYHMIQLLWKDECLQILDENNITGMKSKTRPEIWKKICTALSKEEINQNVRRYIKQRPEWQKADVLQL